MNHDYVLAFRVDDAARRESIEAACAQEWQGDELFTGLWEISSSLPPDAFESALLDRLAAGDRAVFYYVTDAKRVFRIVLDG